MEEFNNIKQPLVAIVGPTASGKTGLSIEIAKHFNGEIISMDSMQIYKYLNIGTAKPDAIEMQGIKHHLLDFVEPNIPFSVNDYVNEAKKAINNIYNSSKLPIICGGTGLYLNSLLYDYNMSETIGNETLRLQLQKEAEEHGVEYIYERLKSLDPKSAEEIHPNNVKRVVRALEICILTGKPRSAQITAQSEPVYDALIFSFDWNRDLLYERINNRVDIMIENGLVNEVKELLEKGILNTPQSIQASQAIGYKEIIDYFEDKCTLEEAIESIKMNSRRYAKRQLTWFRKNEGIIWLDPHCDLEEEVYTKIKKLKTHHNMS